MLDNFLAGIGNRTHRDYNSLSLRIAEIVKRQIVAAAEFSELAHIPGYDVRNLGVILVP